MNKYAKGRRRHTPGEMNRMEAAHALVLEDRKQRGEILWYRFEGVTLKLAKDTRYTPDFCVMLADGTMEMHEVKGFMEDDAWVKLKVAAELFPFAFRLFTRRAKKHGGGTEETVIGGTA